MEHNLKTLEDKIREQDTGTIAYASILLECNLLIEELQNLLKRERFPEKGYCPVWDNAFDYTIKKLLGVSKK